MSESSGKGTSFYPLGGPSPAEEHRRSHHDAQAREGTKTWLDVLGDALVGSQVATDLPGRQRDLDAAVVDAVRHAFGDWTPPGGRPLVERAAEQAAARLRDELPSLIERAVADALEPEGDE